MPPFPTWIVVLYCVVKGDKTFLLNTCLEGALVFELQINMQPFLLKSMGDVKQLWQDQHQGRVTTGLRERERSERFQHSKKIPSLALLRQKGKGKQWSLWNLAINTYLNCMSSFKEKNLPQRNLLPRSEMMMKCTEALWKSLFVQGLIYTTDRIWSWSRVSNTLASHAGCCLAATAGISNLPLLLHQNRHLRLITERWQPDAGHNLGLSVSI